MGLFSKNKKEEKTSCCCGGSCTPETMARAEAGKASGGVKVLGSGCAKCVALEQAAREALEELGMETAIDHVTDFAQIAAYGVMTTPGAGGRRKSCILRQGFKKGRGQGIDPKD